MKDNDNKRRGTGVSSREKLLSRGSERRNIEDRRREDTLRSAESGRTRRSSDAYSSERRRSTDPSRRRSTDTVSKNAEQKRQAGVRAEQRSVDSRARGTKKKKKKKKSWIKRYYRLIIVLVIFFLLAALLVSGILKVFSGSKGRVRRAYAKTISLYQKRDGVAKTILGKDVAKLIDKGNTSQSFTLALTDNTAGAQGISLSGEFNKNTSSKTANANFTAAYNDASLAQFKMYTDNKDIMFSAPGIYDGWLGMDCENIITQLSNSALGAGTELSSDQDFSLKMFTDEKSEGELVLSLSEELSQVFTKEINSLSKKSDYKKLKEKKAVLIDGTEKNCRGYEITIKDEDFKNFLINVLSSVRRNKKIKTYLTQYAKLEYDSVPALKMLFENSDRLVDNYYSQMDDTLNRLNTANFSNTSAVVYLYKGVIADFDFSTVYTLDEDVVNADLRGGMYGGKRPYEDFDLTLVLSDEEKKLNISYAEATDNIDSTLTHTSAFLLGNGTDDLTFSTKVNFDKSTGFINGSANLNTPSGGYIDLSASGNLTKSAGVTKVDAQEIRLDYNGKVNLAMAGSYEIKQFNSKAERPEGDIIELFKADDAQLDQIENTIAANLENAVDNLNKALESLNFTIGTAEDTQTEALSETSSEETTASADDIVTEETAAEETTQTDDDTESDSDQ